MAAIEAIASAAREVGDRALERWRHLVGGGAVKQWAKADASLVCEVDLDTDRRLKGLLGALAPDAGWLSEETADDSARLRCGRLWCVDPIDGTRDFLRGRTGWAVSIALVEQGAPIAGVLYAPARDELWVAAAGEGATLNGRRLAVGERARLAGSRVPSHDLPREDRDLAKVAQPNSIALRMAMIADDRADLVATLRWGSEWDIAAAALIVAEAGGVVTDALGAPLRFNKPDPQAFGVLATVPGIHDAAVARLAGRARTAVRG